MSRLLLHDFSPPLTDQFVQPGGPHAGFLTAAWDRWFGLVQATLQSYPTKRRSVTLTDQSDSIGATDLGPGSLSAGLYRVDYYARVTRVGTVSSSLTVTFAWTDGAVAQSWSGAAMTGNATTTNQFGSLVLHIDKATAVNYSTTYASNPANRMQYRLDMVIWQL